MKFVHIADVHLGMKPDQGFAWSEDRARELFETFYHAVEYCEKEEVDLLLIAGDLFHRQPSAQELQNVNEVFQKLTSTQVVLIAGNHDYAGNMSEYRRMKWADHVKMLSWEQPECYYIETLNTYIYGYSYGEQQIKTNRLACYMPKTKDGLHILLQYSGDKDNNSCDQEELERAGFDYVALGHSHNPVRLADTIAYPGSLEPLNKSESGPHGFIQGQVSKEGILLQFVDFSKRQYEDVRVMLNPSMGEMEVCDAVKEAIKERNPDHLFRIVLEGAVDSELPLLEQSMYLLGNIVDVQNKTYPDMDYGKLINENKDNIVGMYITAIYSSEETYDIKDRALYYGVKALLDSESSETVHSKE